MTHAAKDSRILTGTVRRCVGRLVRRFWWPSLWREIALLKRIQESSNLDWAEDHTHLQNLCREVGCTELEIEGDSDGVPGIMELADVLRKRIPPNNCDDLTPGEANAKQDGGCRR